MSLSKFWGQQLLLPEIKDSPHQPPATFKFPQREFGKQTIVKRSFQHSWFQKYPWLHYDEKNDSAYCFNCVNAYKQKKLKVSSADTCFISRGYTNWKDGLTRFRDHCNSHCHRDATIVTVDLPSTTKDIAEQLNNAVANQKQERRELLLKPLSNVRYLGRQAIPLRGHDNDENSNFMQLFKLRSEEDPRIVEWLNKKQTNISLLRFKMKC